MALLRQNPLVIPRQSNIIIIRSLDRLREVRHVHGKQNDRAEAGVCGRHQEYRHAFANCDGGTIYVGVEDDGTVRGVEDADGTMLRVTNAIRDAVRPDLTMFLDCVVRPWRESR